ASRMRGSVRTSANGRPSSRAKRARSRSRRIRDSASAIRGGTMGRKSGGSIRWVIIPCITTTYRPMSTLRFKASAIRRSHRRAQREGEGVGERLVGTLKKKLLWVRSFARVAELDEALREFKPISNERWLIGRHGFRSPRQVRLDSLAASERFECRSDMP